MRPINLIPKEERGSHGGIARTGPLMYVILGALAVALIGVVLLVLTSNKISDHESEIARLEAQKSQVAAKTARLTPYVDFEGVAKQRIETVTSLADERFDWARVVHQLSLVLPPGTNIELLTAASAGGSEASALATQSPALSISGCTTGQDGTAAVITAMKQIDGVTRVGLISSVGSGSGESEESGKGSGEVACPAGATAFSLTAVFDEAPQPSEATVVESPPAEPEASEAASSEEGESSGETAVSSSGDAEGTG